MDIHIVDFHESHNRQKFYLAMIPVQQNDTIVEVTIVFNQLLVRKIMAFLNGDFLDPLTDRQSEKIKPNPFLKKTLEIAILSETTTNAMYLLRNCFWGLVLCWRINENMIPINRIQQEKLVISVIQLQNRTITWKPKCTYCCSSKLV